MIAKKYLHMIEDISDETGNEDGYWIYLKNGYWLPSTETHCISEDTKEYAISRLSEVEPCHGPCCHGSTGT